MAIERPDLTSAPAAIVAYIEALEEELAQRGPRTKPVTEFVSDEPPTTLNVISMTKQGLAKRTARHFYGRQRRGGMGVFDIDSGDDDHPAFLTVADEAESLLLLTDKGRAFRLPVGNIPLTDVRGRGQPFLTGFTLLEDEKLVAVLPDAAGTSLVVASEKGWVRRYRASFVGRTMYQGTSLHDATRGGSLVAACWSIGGDEDLLVVTERGQGIRFPGRHVRDRRGCLGLRVAESDRVVAVTPVDEQAGVFLCGADGKGTIRLMSGLRANKAPGAGGKLVMKVEKLLGAVTVADGEDLFLISNLSKIIRFAAEEVPAKSGAVQGVNCISLRADEAVAVAAGRVPG